MLAIIVSGNHVPVMPFKSVAGKTGGWSNAQSVSIEASSGTTVGIIVTEMVSVTKHW